MGAASKSSRSTTEANRASCGTLRSELFRQFDRRHCLGQIQQPVRAWRRFPVGFMGSAALVLGVVAAVDPLAGAEEPRTYQLDPFTQATAGYAGCPEAKPPVLTEQEMRVSAHQRAERGTSCCLAGTCECGGAYKRDPEINDRVAAAIKADSRFAKT